MCAAAILSIDEGLHPRFNPDPEAVGDTVHVGVVGDNLDDVENVPVGESGSPERSDIG